MHTSHRKPRTCHHIMGQPWTGNGHSYQTCTKGCGYTLRDGVSVGTQQPAAPAAAQGALFDVWGAGIVPTSQDH